MGAVGRPATPPRPTRPRALPLLVGAVVLVDSLMYAALTPLLPAYADRFDLSKTGAGVLAGVYAAGAMLGAAPSAWLAARVGARRTLLAGLALKAVAGLGFAFGQTIVVLDATRFLLGLGAACSWAGGMGWLVAATPPERRGTTIGGAMGAAVVGFLLGPVLGAVARVTGPELPFGAVGVLAAVLGLCAARLPAPPRAPAARGRLAPALRDPRIRVGAWLVTANALAIGAVEVLAPLRLDALGAGGVVIGATFLAAAAVEGGVQLVVGRATDRWGRAAPIRIALAGLVGALLLLPLPQALAAVRRRRHARLGRVRGAQHARDDARLRRHRRPPARPDARLRGHVLRLGGRAGRRRGGRRAARRAHLRRGGLRRARRPVRGQLRGRGAPGRAGAQPCGGRDTVALMPRSASLWATTRARISRSQPGKRASRSHSAWMKTARSKTRAEPA